MGKSEIFVGRIGTGAATVRVAGHRDAGVSVLVDCVSGSVLGNGDSMFATGLLPAAAARQLVGEVVADTPWLQAALAAAFLDSLFRTADDQTTDGAGDPTRHDAAAPIGPYLDDADGGDDYDDVELDERAEIVAAGRKEFDPLARSRRLDIRMFPLFGEPKPTSGVVIPASTLSLREIVESIGLQFKREMHFDFPPFDAQNPAMDGVLIDGRFLATFPIAAGAAGLSLRDGRWWMDWIWIHPYDRGKGLINKAMDDLDATHGDFGITGPYSPAMSAIIQRRGITGDRLDHQLHAEGHDLGTAEGGGVVG